MSASVGKVTLIACGFAALSYAQAGAQPNKVGIIHIQNAIISTQDGQQAAAELQARFEPRSKELEKKNNEINALREQLQGCRPSEIGVNEQHPFILCHKCYRKIYSG